MDIQTNFRLLRLKEVLHLTGISSSTHYLQVQQGLMVKPISLGANSSAYPLFEIETINAARIAGKNQNEIKELVTTLMENRINII